MAISIFSPLTGHYCGEAREDFFNVKNKRAKTDPAGVFGFCYKDSNWVTVSGIDFEMLRRTRRGFFQGLMKRNCLDWSLQIVETKEPFRDKPVGFLEIRGDKVEDLITHSKN